MDLGVAGGDGSFFLGLCSDGDGDIKSECDWGGSFTFVSLSSSVYVFFVVVFFIVVVEEVQDWENGGL